MIILCELKKSGRVTRHQPPGGIENPLGWVLAQGFNFRQAGTRRVWIERLERPASFPTIAMQERWQMRTARKGPMN